MEIEICQAIWSGSFQRVLRSVRIIDNAFCPFRRLKKGSDGQEENQICINFGFICFWMKDCFKWLMAEISCNGRQQIERIQYVFVNAEIQWFIESIVNSKRTETSIISCLLVNMNQILWDPSIKCMVFLFKRSHIAMNHVFQREFLIVNKTSNSPKFQASKPLSRSLFDDQLLQSSIRGLSWPDHSTHNGYLRLFGGELPSSPAGRQTLPAAKLRFPWP
jgi:hypothetical protein